MMRPLFCDLEIILLLLCVSCIIHVFNSGQMQGVGSRRHNILFQGFRNKGFPEVNALVKSKQYEK